MQLSFYDLDYFTALVFAAVRACPMRADLLMTVRAFGELGDT